MMNAPPDIIDGARVLRWSCIGRTHRPTGNCQHTVTGRVPGDAAALAIVRYDEKSGFDLFGCDADWNSVMDSWHGTLEEALAQAEFEYEGIAKTWNVVPVIEADE